MSAEDEGMLKVWVLPEAVIVKSVPNVSTIKLCDATLLPFNDVILPPVPPASSPQKKVPLSQRSFFVTELHADSDAP